jgi:hypothetical protein
MVDEGRRVIPRNQWPDRAKARSGASRKPISNRQHVADFKYATRCAFADAISKFCGAPAKRPSDRLFFRWVRSAPSLDLKGYEPDLPCASPLPAEAHRPSTA